jgi:carbamate kinase
MKPTAVIAIGGNSLISDQGRTTVADQYAAVVEACGHIGALLASRDLNLVVTHGNGPQVGFILRRSELAAPELHMVPLDSCVADTQGALGYQLQCALGNEFRKRQLARAAVTVVTQVRVDEADPAFQAPNKPIGSFLSAEVARLHQARDGWQLVEDAGRGWRRVVASPQPREVVELDQIRTLLAAGAVTIACGGGGIPVARDAQGELRGVAAVIDKDLASSLLAQQLGAEMLVISTAVEQVCLDYGTPSQRSLSVMTLAEARQYIREGHFKPGSMLPKVQAVVDFLEHGGREAIITDPSHLSAAFQGQGGTRIIP